MASEFDLALFREAQAQACQAIEDQLKGLPDVKGTKYIEMGRNEMEVKMIRNYFKVSTSVASYGTQFGGWGVAFKNFNYHILTIFTLNKPYTVPTKSPKLEA